MSSNPLSSILVWVFHQARLLSYFNFFLCTKSFSSCVNCPNLMSSWLLITFMIGPSVTFGRFPSEFSKCCFHRCIRSSRLVAFSLSFAVLFLLLTSFTVCHAILDCLSSTVFLILLIWFCMYSVCSFSYTLVSLFYAFLRFWVWYGLGSTYCVGMRVLRLHAFF